MNNNEIEITALIKVIWDKRKYIIKFTAIFFVIGLFYAFLSPKVYTSQIVMVTQTAENADLIGDLGGLASMAGVDLSKLSLNKQTISPLMYPQIIENVLFQKDLMNTKINIENGKKQVTIFEYYTQYQKNILKLLAKYTIGLPSQILKQVNKKKLTLNDTPSNLITITEEEKEVMKAIEKKLSITINKKGGYIILSADASEPLAATEIVLAAKELLQKYITQIKIEKAQSDLNFITERYLETKKEYEEAQKRLANFRDMNRNITSAVIKTQEEKLINDYNLAYMVYSNLAKQLEQAKIRVKDETPVFSIIQPAYIPIEKNKPKRFFIVTVFTLLGMVFSSIKIILKDFKFFEG